VTVTYRTAGAWGAGKGSNLTAAEVDANFWDHEGRLDTLEGTPPAPNNIADITVSGSQMTITMDDASTFGPFTLPTSRWRWREDFADATVYAVEDFFRDADTGSIYRVLIAHTSATPFDPDLLSGGDPVYELIIDASGFGAGGGGLFSDVVVDTGATYTVSETDAGKLIQLEYDTGGVGPTVEIANDSTAFDLAVGTTIGFAQYGSERITIDELGASIIYDNTKHHPQTDHQYSVIYLTKIDVDTWLLHGDLRPLHDIVVITSGTTWTPTRSSHQNKYVTYSESSAVAVTIPTNTAQPFDRGSTITIADIGGASGRLTFAPDTGVTLISRAGTGPTTVEYGSVVTLKKVNTNVWHIFGDYE
jgi:hypothetical protein